MLARAGVIWGLAGLGGPSWPLPALAVGAGWGLGAEPSRGAFPWASTISLRVLPDGHSLREEGASNFTHIILRKSYDTAESYLARL